MTGSAEKIVEHIIERVESPDIKVEAEKKMLNLQLVIVVFQTILVLLGIWFREELIDHENRLRELEEFKSAGDNWTTSEHYAFEGKLEERLSSMQEDLAVIKSRLGVPDKRK